MQAFSPPLASSQAREETQGTEGKEMRGRERTGGMEEGRVCLLWETGRREAELALKGRVPKSKPGPNCTRSVLEISSNH